MLGSVPVTPWGISVWQRTFQMDRGESEVLIPSLFRSNSPSLCLSLAHSRKAQPMVPVKTSGTSRFTRRLSFSRAHYICVTLWAVGTLRLHLCAIRVAEDVSTHQHSSPPASLHFQLGVCVHKLHIPKTENGSELNRSSQILGPLHRAHVNEQEQEAELAIATIGNH